MSNLEVFKSPFFQVNGQLQTILPALFRKTGTPNYERERLTLSDNDFVDLDWIKNGNNRLVILSHGLEGNSDRAYIKGMANWLESNNCDVLAWNCRSCSGTMNLAPRLYHHGEVGDIGEVINHAIKQYEYDAIWLVGFSMGANISLNYLGKNGTNIPEQVKGAVVCSAPLDLKNGMEQLHTSEGAFYRKRFFKQLAIKLKAKEKQFPGIVDISRLDTINHWAEFDRHFSAPLHGFKDENDFYANASPVNFMHDIARPSLIVNAWNDPLLGKDCYPIKLVEGLKNVWLEIPKNGGHVGFSERGKRVSWFERRVLSFIEGDLYD